MCRRFSAGFVGVDGTLISLDYVVVNSVFYVTGGVRRAEDTFIVGLVFREQQRGISLEVQIAVSQIGVRGSNCPCAFMARNVFQGWLRCTDLPCPRVAKP